MKNYLIITKKIKWYLLNRLAIKDSEPSRSADFYINQLSKLKDSDKNKDKREQLVKDIEHHIDKLITVYQAVNNFED